MTVIVNFKDIITLCLLGIAVALLIAGFMVDRAVCAVKKRKRKRIDEANKEAEEGE